MSETALAARQHAFARALRDPSLPAPAGLDPARLALYRRLLRDNVDRALARVFPVLRRTLAAATWDACRDDFLLRHHCRTPLFRALGGEFVRYLEHRDGGPPLPAYAAALAHYEWLEAWLAAAPDPAEPGPLRDGDLLDGVPVLSPLVVLQAYDWPVHRIGAALQPAAPLAVPVFLLLNRDAAGTVRFLEVDALGAALVDSLRRAPQRSGRAQLSALAAHHGLAPDVAFAAGGALLARLRERGAILGVRAA
ncbi:HvfC family RiPP maturation protein [Solimonas variicoloris]|uniref:HvfC family RiPP maturation protein n=1 Tax=Solimonas variicoloris TaxID=254408 RepID=UPI00035FAE84|nr:putative DNA-binding domain-containing protein [Solimonas variicoloris]